MALVSGMRRREMGGAVLAYAALLLFAVVFVGPFLWMVSTSLKTDAQVFTEDVQWIPRPFVWSNYPSALDQFPFLL